ncbi:MAG: hypothetical protein QOJ00_2073 [Actinomycetota bacterium]
MIRRIARITIAAIAFAPASLFIAHQYDDGDKPSSSSDVSTSAQRATTTTVDTTPTTLITAKPATKDITRDNYAAFGISFQRPKHWRAQTFPEHTSGSTSPIVYLSADEVSNPCDTSTTGATECGWPVDMLTPNNPLVVWTVSLDAPPPPPNTVIDGQIARVDAAKPGACKEIQGDETIVAAIARPSGGVFYMRACLSGDQLAAAEQNVYAMLASVTVA